MITPVPKAQDHTEHLEWMLVAMAMVRYTYNFKPAIG